MLKATAATKKEAAALAELAAAAAKATLTQSDLASAERRAAEGRRRSAVVPGNVLSQTAQPTSSLNASAQGIRNTSAAANSLGQAVSGLNTMLKASVDDMMLAAVEAREYRMALDEIRMSISPLFAASKEYEEQLDRIARAERVGAITAHEAAAERAAAAAKLAPGGNGPSGNGPRGPGRVSSFATANLAAQGNDIAVMIAAGQDPRQLALQQGTQVSQVLNQVGGGKEAIHAIGAGFVSMLNPISLATIGIIGFGAAGVQWLMSLRKESKSFDEAMGDLSDSISSYEKNMSRARSSTHDLSREFGAAADEVKRLSAEMAELDRRAAQRAAADVFSGLKDEVGLKLTALPEGDFLSSGGSIATMQAQGAARLDRIADERKLREMFGLDKSAEAQSLIGTVLDAVSAANSAEGLDQQIETLKNLREAWLAAAEAQGSISKEADAELQKIQQAEEQLQKARALGGNPAGLQAARDLTRTLFQQVELESARKTHGEESAAFRAVENRHEREALELRLEDLGIARQSMQWRLTMLSFFTLQAQQEEAALEAQRERVRSQNDNLAAIQRETSLIGASAAEQARINALAEAEIEIRDRKLVGLEAEEERQRAIARAEAEIRQSRQRALHDLGISRMMDGYDTRIADARNPWIRADIEAEKEYARVMAESGDVVTARARADHAREKAIRDLHRTQGDFLRGQAEGLQQMQLELALLGQTAQVRARVLAQVQAERDILRFGVTGGQAELIRQQAQAQLELSYANEEQADAWQRVQSAGENAIDGVLDSLRSGDIKGAFADMIGEIEAGFFDLAIRNPLKNMLLGTNLGTFDSIGGWDGVWGRLSGKTPIDEASIVKAAATPVQSMMVQAAQVTLSGNLSGLGAGLLGAANMNAAPGILPGSADVQAQIWSFFAGKGLAPHQIAGIMGNVAGESSFNPFSKGDYSNGVPTSFGLFQHHKTRADGLLAAVGGQGGLGDVEGQLEFVWKELQTTHNAALRKLLASSNVQDATSVWMRDFEVPSQSAMQDSWGARLAAAEASMARFEATTVSAQEQLGQLGTGAAQLGTGLHDFGSGLAGVIQNAGAQRGVGGMLLGGVLTGLGKMIGIPGFSGGGWTGSGAPTDVSGLVHAEEYVFDAAATRRIGVANLEAIRRGTMPGYIDGGSVTGGRAVAMPSAAGSATGAAHQPQRVVFEINVSGTGNQEIFQGVHSAIGQAFDTYDQQALPDRVKMIVNDRWGS